MMKTLLPLTLCLLLPGILFAATPTEENSPSTKQQTPQQEMPAGNSTPQRPAPAPTFTPSEKVGADSAVSFPVDI